MYNDPAVEGEGLRSTPLSEPAVASGAPLGQRAKHSAFLPQIESIRGLAALAVAWCHCGFCLLFAVGVQFNVYEQWILRGIGASAWATNARAAVILFFVVSGLVLGLMLDAAPRRSPAGGYYDFLRRRVLRIYPAHIAALLLFVPLAAVTLFAIPVADPVRLAAAPYDPRIWFDGTVYGHVEAWQMLRTATFYHQYYNGVTWSLRVEMLACLFVPLFALLSRPGRLAVDALVLGALVASAALVDVSTHPDSVFLYLPAFYLGCIARTQGPRLVAALTCLPGARAAVLLLSYLLCTAPAAWTVTATVTLGLVLSMSLGAFGIVVLVAWGRLRPVDAVLLHPLARWMGRLSYSFYLWHWLILCAISRLIFICFTWEQLARQPLLVLAGVTVTSIVIAFGVAALSYRWIERPFIALGHSRFARWPRFGRDRAAAQPIQVEPTVAERASA